MPGEDAEGLAAAREDGRWQRRTADGSERVSMLRMSCDNGSERVTMLRDVAWIVVDVVR